ncbi:hypothetical protein [Pseudovibrio sp. Tun.PSC04-5.I4]|uniref:hypothetical protein n=1 Tax=Pseudovibrio sp. Tun.PSC04-5.I4 TaxID=1798213 RepID=UPI00088241CC|nr:hypothetical protein [Pseudovibrio sp. Tun.PSC04-5.I4]SDQ90644.1 hypothetical protein SAMN04515695_1847 [Pseudovibrio sp. Tun.PSC04-5.I4]
MLRSLIFSGLIAVSSLAVVFSASASEKEGFTGKRDDMIPPLEMFKTMASDLEPEGWITFQALDGRQIIDFSPIMSLRCRLKEIKYSIDSKDLDKTMPVPACDPEYPFRLEAQGIHKPYVIEFPGGTVQALAIQLMWEDGTSSEIGYFQPCRAVGAVPCAYPIGSRL